MNCKHYTTKIIELTPMLFCQVCSDCEETTKVYSNLASVMKDLGWQGGTIHQVREAIKTRTFSKEDNSAKCKQCGSDDDLMVAFTKHGICGVCTKKNHRRALA